MLYPYVSKITDQILRANGFETVRNSKLYLQKYLLGAAVLDKVYSNM